MALVSRLAALSRLRFPDYTGTRVMMMPIVLGDLNSIPDTLGPWKRVLEPMMERVKRGGEIGYLTIDEGEVDEGDTQRRDGIHVDGRGPLRKVQYPRPPKPFPPKPDQSDEPSPFPLRDRPIARGWIMPGMIPWVETEIPKIHKHRHTIDGVEKERETWYAGWAGPRPWAGPHRLPSWLPKPDDPEEKYEYGMLQASRCLSHDEPGCRAWEGEIDGEPGEEGNCEHLREELDKHTVVELEPERMYWMDGDTVHESLPMPVATKRQFIRLSLPLAEAPWFMGYTENPLGIQPSGPILGPRPDSFMAGKN